MPCADDISPDDLRITDEEIAEMRAAARAREAAEATKATKPKRERQAKPFVMVPMKELIAATVALEGPTVRLWFFLVYQTRVAGEPAVKLSNHAVRDWQLDRRAKCRALRALEAAGLVTVERRGQQAPVVTLRPVSS